MEDSNKKCQSTDDESRKSMSVCLEGLPLCKFQKMREECSFIDVIIVCKDLMFSAHKLILSANIPYFEKSFHAEIGGQLTIPTENDKVLLNPLAVMTVLESIYSRKILFNWSNVADILAVLKFFEMEGCLQKCLMKILDSINEDNFVLVWDMAEAYGSDKCQAKVYEYLLVHCKEFQESKSFLQLDKDKFIRLVNFDRVDKHSTAAELVVNWINHDKSGRLCYLNELLDVIDLSKLSEFWIGYFIENEPLFDYSKLSPRIMKNIWKKMCTRAKLLWCLDGDANSRSIQVHLLNPFTNAWLGSQLVILPNEENSNVICEGTNVYSICKEEIVLYHSETRSRIKIPVKLPNYESDSGSFFCIDNCFYYLKGNEIMMYKLNSGSSQWSFGLPNFQKFVHPAVVEIDGFLYIINNDLMIQVFHPESSSCGGYNFSEYLKHPTRGKSFIICSVKEKIFLYSNSNSSELIVIDTKKMRVKIRKFISDCPLEDILWISVEEMDDDKISLLAVNSSGIQWKYKETKREELESDDCRDVSIMQDTSCQTPFNPFWYLDRNEISLSIISESKSLLQYDPSCPAKPAMSFEETLKILTTDVSQARGDAFSQKQKVNLEVSTQKLKFPSETNSTKQVTPSASSVKTNVVLPTRVSFEGNYQEEEKKSSHDYVSLKSIAVKPQAKPAFQFPVLEKHSPSGFNIEKPNVGYVSNQQMSAFGFRSSPAIEKDDLNEQSNPYVSIKMNFGISEKEKPIGFNIEKPNPQYVSNQQKFSFGASSTRTQDPIVPSSSNEVIPSMQSAPILISKTNSVAVGPPSEPEIPKISGSCCLCDTIARQATSNHFDSGFYETALLKSQELRNTQTVGTAGNHGLRFYCIVKGRLGICEQALITKGDIGRNEICSAVKYSKVFPGEVNVKELSKKAVVRF